MKKKSRKKRRKEILHTQNLKIKTKQKNKINITFPPTQYVIHNVYY